MQTGRSAGGVSGRYKQALALDLEDAGKQGIEKLLSKAEKAAKKDEVYPWE